MSRSLTSSVLSSLSYIHTHIKCNPFSFISPKYHQPRARVSVWRGRGWGKRQLVVTMGFTSQDINNLQMSITHPSLKPLSSPVPLSSASQPLTKSQKIPPNHVMFSSTSPLYIHEVERKLRLRETGTVRELARSQPLLSSYIWTDSANQRAPHPSLWTI